VCWDKKNKKWYVRIKVGGKRKSLGRFTDEGKAGRAFDKYIVDNNLDHPLNFPVAAEEDGESPGESYDAGEHFGAAAAPAVKRRKTSIS